MEESVIFHLRFGIIVTDQKHCRFVIARVDTETHPLVFLREWTEDETGYEVFYSLYKEALSAEEADEILSLLKTGEKRRAGTLLKRYFKEEGILCRNVGKIRLDDAVRDEWYDCWKEMEGFITVPKDYPGYYETDVPERRLL